MKANDDRNDTFFEAEYKRLMAEAYPAPKTDIKNAVMARISAESQVDDAEKLNTTGKKRAAWKSHLVKWGSVAACFIVLAALGFHVLSMNMKGGMVENASVSTTADTSEEAEYNTLEEEEGAAGMIYEAKVTSAVDEQAPEEAEMSEDEEDILEEEAVLEMPVEQPAPEMAVMYSTKKAAVDEDMTNGSSGMPASSHAASSFADYDASGIPEKLSSAAEDCQHTGVFKNSFHDITQSVINLAVAYAGGEKLLSWYEQTNGTCEMNLYALIVAMEIPQEALEEMYNTSDLWYHHDYNIALLYGDAGADAVYDYYLTGGSYAEYVKRYFEYELKQSLVADDGVTQYGEWTAEHGYNAICRWSIAEFVRDFGITRDRFVELYDKMVVRFASEYAGYEIVEYDIDAIYAMGEEIADSIARGDMGYVTDAMYHK